MKKKLVTMLLAIISACCLAVGLAACGEKPATPNTPHSHDYRWVNNGDGTHKQHCQNAGCDAPDINSGDHTWDANGKCEKCNATKLNDSDDPDDGNDPLPPVSAESKIISVSSELTKDDETSYSLKEKLASTATTYDLTGKITVSNGAQFKVYSNQSCTDELNTSSIPLTADTTTVYIKVTNGNSSSVYKLTLNRKVTFNVKLYYNETELYYDGKVEEGSDEVTLPKPQLDDYTFENGYYTDITYKKKFDGKVTQDTDLYLSASYHGVTVQGSVVTGLKGNPKGRVNLVIDAASATSIKEDAFKDCLQLKSVTISNSITEIGEGAFRGCNTLESMTVPFTGRTGEGDSYTSANCAFGYIFGAAYKTTTSTHINYQWYDDEYYYWAHIPETLKSVTVLGGEMVSFYNCVNIYYVNIVNKIDGFMFGACTSLREVSLPEGLTTIPRNSFNTCYMLRRITIPSSVTEIGNRAFRACFSLMEVYDKSSMHLTEVNIGTTGDPQYVERVYSSSTEKSNITVTDDGFVFYSDNSKTVLIDYEGNESIITLPSNFNGKGYSIGANAFYANLNVVSITIPKGVTAIEDGAIAMRNNIHEVYNLSGVDYKVNNHSYFHYATSASEKSQVTLKDGYIFFTDSEAANWLVGYIGTEVNLVLPDDCNGETYGIITSCFASLYKSSTYGDIYLESVVISDGVTSIGAAAFSGSLVKDVTVGKNVATIERDVFTSTNLGTVVWGATRCKFVCSSGTSDAPFRFMNIETLIIKENVTYIPSCLFFEAQVQTLVFEATSGWEIVISSGNIKLKESTFQDMDTVKRYLTIGTNKTPSGYATYAWERKA